MTSDWRSLYRFGSRHFDIDGFRMHYIDEGNGEPLLMVHGNPTWSFYWRNLIQSFRGGYRTVVPDHLGCGLSDKPQEYNYCLQQHADNLVALIEELNLDGITLLAHDWGGAIGLLAASQVPDRFARFVLFNTGAFPPPRVPLRIASCRLPFIGKFVLRGMNAFATTAQVMATEKNGGLDRAVLDGLIAPYDTWANRVGIYHFVNDIPLSKTHLTYPVLERLEAFLPQLDSKPVQFIWGMKDWCFTPQCLDKFLEHIPSAAVHRIDDAGHWVIEDAPDDVIAVVAKFIAANPLATSPVG
ncbi:MAG: alpha/beta fold hydrolase [Planctomycetota bacterium]